MLHPKPVDGQAYRDAMARFAGQVHLITSDGPAGRRGTTVIAACSVSDDPPTVLVCLNRHNPNNQTIFDNGVFALNTLAQPHQALSQAFAGLGGMNQDERFSLGEWSTLSTGSPVLKGAMAVFDCVVEEARDFATHRVLFGKVTGLATGDSLDPLIYFNRSYRA
ncbi:flavin reductase [Zhengella sp.]|uniref:flavin reductase n=1 Tax=Zhengella sp. TaxID=2282762 RepID=UPI0035287011